MRVSPFRDTLKLLKNVPKQTELLNYPPPPSAQKKAVAATFLIKAQSDQFIFPMPY